MKYYSYVQPGIHPETHEIVIVSEEDAIKTQKLAVSKSTPEFVYGTDQDALLDFISVTWANEVKFAWETMPVGIDTELGKYLVIKPYVGNSSDY